jgi:hypothetical protein
MEYIEFPKMVANKQKKEFGDFQTPMELALNLCALLKANGVRANSIIEPTCGVGYFAQAALGTWQQVKALYCMDVNPEYVHLAKKTLQDPRADYCVGSFFEHDWESTLAKLPSPGLVIGNLPWVTNAQVGVLGGNNLPQKNNFQGRNGFDAITGKANFDISEWMMLKMLDWCERHQLTIALLVKTTVARKVLKQAWENNRGIGSAAIYRIDSMRWFGAAVDACLFVFTSSRNEDSRNCSVHDSIEAPASTIMGFRGGELVSDIRLYEEAQPLLGGSPIRWRSGIKHDCSKVMELEQTADRITNGLGEDVNLEPQYLFPLYKSSQLAKGETKTNRLVLITQRQVGQPTEEIAQRAPKTWEYLTQHSKALDARGSIIYKKNSRFAIFGVGEYSFSPFKVAISGLYKAPNFVVLGTHHGKPSMVDDTASFLSFESHEDAVIVAKALNSERARHFFSVFAFLDAKRPYTVEVLSKLNITKLIADLFGPTRVPKMLNRDASVETVPSKRSLRVSNSKQSALCLQSG